MKDQVQRRLADFSDLQRPTVQRLQDTLFTSDLLIRELRSAGTEAENENMEYHIVIVEGRTPVAEHAHRYNRQLSTEVAPQNRRDITIHFRRGGLMRINELHWAYQPLQYPLLFPHGTHGWNRNFRDLNGRKLTMRQYMAPRLITRPGNYLLKAKRLFQMYVVDGQSRIESERLNYLRFHQNDLRWDTHRGFHDGLIEQDGEAAQTGRRVILPSTFTGGAPYLNEQAADAMSYATKFGKADFFIPITTNPKWPEFQQLAPNGQILDRPDLLSRVFYLKKKNVFWTWSRKTKSSAKYRHTSTPLNGRREDYLIWILWFGSQQIEESDRTTSIILSQRRSRFSTKILSCTEDPWTMW